MRGTGVLAFLALIGCNGDSSFTKRNNEPVAKITSHSDGDSVEEGFLTTFRGTVSDTNDGADELVATWLSGAETLCAEAPVGTPPDVVIDLPLDGDFVNEGDSVTFAATVADDSTASDALVLSWESDLDGVIDTTAADASGVATFDATWLSAGDHTVTLTVTDADGLYAVATTHLTVNGLPTAPTISISPNPAGTDDDLVVSIDADAVDAEGDPLVYGYSWTVDGAATAYTGATIPASATTRDEVWEVTVTANDGYGDGTSGVASITVSNSPPSLVSAALTPDPAVEGDTLTCTPGTSADADGDTVS